MKTCHSDLLLQEAKLNDGQTAMLQIHLCVHAQAALTRSLLRARIWLGRVLMQPIAVRLLPPGTSA